MADTVIEQASLHFELTSMCLLHVLTPCDSHLILVQVPQYSLTYTDDGIQERLQLIVQLPG